MTFNCLRSNHWRSSRKTKFVFCLQKAPFVYAQRYSLIVVLVIISYLSLLWWYRTTHDYGLSPGEEYDWRDTEAQHKTDKLRIVLCAKVDHENPYLLEWIEFHRIQGVDKFVLYHDAIPADATTVMASMDLHWLPVLYRQVEKRRTGDDTKSDVVEILPAAVLIPDLAEPLLDVPHNTRVTHRILQPAMLVDCIERYKHKAEYVLHIDVDEFLYAPLYPSVWDFLMSQRTGERWRSFRYGKVVGYNIPMVNFGSSGQFWDFHNMWAPDISTGNIQTYFDPRDSSVFRYLTQKFVKLQNTDPPIIPGGSASAVNNITEFTENMLKELIAFRLRRIDKDRRTDDIHSFAKSKLEEDFPGPERIPTKKDSATTTDITDGNSTSFPPFPVLPPGSTSQYQLLLDLYLKAFMDKGKDWTSFGSYHNGSAAVQTVKSQTTDVLKRVQEYKAQMTQALLSYPLLIEEQIFRSARWPLDTEKVQKHVTTRFKICQIPTEHRAAYLMNNEGYIHIEDAKKDNRLLNYLCSSSFPDSVTQNSKSIYLMKSLQRSGTSRRTGRLRGCFRPGAHSCGHSLARGSKFLVADPVTQLKLDHHQFRSYERRTFGLPKWRGGPEGFTAKFNYTLLQAFTSSLMDDGKVRFILELRRRLLDFHPLPKLPEYTLLVKNSGSRVIPTNVFQKCSPLELLGEHQVMCPERYPYVGFTDSSDWGSPSQPFNPYMWCTDIPQNKTIAWFDHIRLPKSAGLTNEQNFHKHAILCAGYGESRCCDYDPMLENLRTWRYSGFNNTLIWQAIKKTNAVHFI